eukprot:TRINITY_DN20328_c0_g1_i2.p1 TRINITY_DN20328_c0_g1~~TRINITY_DN20328_c0_g1_i2.p1  ORF type:complete len:529 (+),score=54.74 TRINITY_DN20328_c0_g1_i2:26-1588(+)
MELSPFHAEVLARIASFKVGYRSVFNPVECARHGWRYLAENTVVCEVCGVERSGKFDLQFGHADWCIYNEYSYPMELLNFHPHDVSLEAFFQRFSILSNQISEPAVISQHAIAALSAYMHDIELMLTNAQHMVSEFNKNIFIVVLLGWDLVNSRLKCRYCQHEIPMDSTDNTLHLPANFQPFDHRYFCSFMQKSTFVTNRGTILLDAAETYLAKKTCAPWELVLWKCRDIANKELRLAIAPRMCQVTLSFLQKFVINTRQPKFDQDTAPHVPEPPPVAAVLSAESSTLVQQPVEEAPECFGGFFDNIDCDDTTFPEVYVAPSRTKSPDVCLESNQGKHPFTQSDASTPSQTPTEQQTVGPLPPAPTPVAASQPPVQRIPAIPVTPVIPVIPTIPVIPVAPIPPSKPSAPVPIVAPPRPIPTITMVAPQREVVVPAASTQQQRQQVARTLLMQKLAAEKANSPKPKPGPIPIPPVPPPRGGPAMPPRSFQAKLSPQPLPLRPEKRGRNQNTPGSGGKRPRF